jgi:hypothetical protein
MRDAVIIPGLYITNSAPDENAGKNSGRWQTAWVSHAASVMPEEPSYRYNTLLLSLEAREVTELKLSDCLLTHCTAVARYVDI